MRRVRGFEEDIREREQIKNDLHGLHFSENLTRDKGS